MVLGSATGGERHVGRGGGSATRNYLSKSRTRYVPRERETERPRKQPILLLFLCGLCVLNNTRTQKVEEYSISVCKLQQYSFPVLVTDIKNDLLSDAVIVYVGMKTRRCQ